MSSAAIRAIVMDIEGTTTPIAFVRDVLFPYARAHLSAFLAEHAGQEDIATILNEVRFLAPDRAPETALRGWMDEDAKVTPLKTLQGLIWEHGYREGAISSLVYKDVPPALRRWQEAGHALFVYSSGSVAAQHQLFGYSNAGDLRPHFFGYFDTTIGGKRETDSYRAIAAQIGVDAAAILFLSDIEQELDAARAAGWQTTQLVRAEDGTRASETHPTASDFSRIAP